MSLSLNNSTDLIANSIHLIQGNEFTNVLDLFLTKSEAHDIVGIAPETLDTLAEIAQAIGNDANFFTTINNQIALKANIADVYDKSYVDTLINNYYTKAEIDTSLSLKLDRYIDK